MLVHALAVIGSLLLICPSPAAAQTAPPQIWGVTANYEIFRRVNGAWERLPQGLLKQISIASDGTVWGVSKDDNIFRWNGSAWTTIGGKLRQVSVGGDALVWGTNAANEVFRYTGNKGWERMPGQLKQVAIAADKTVVGIDPNNKVVFWGDDATWKPNPGILTQIAVGSKTQIYGVGPNGAPYKWSGSQWSVLPGVLVDVSVSADGELWGTNSANQVYKWTASAWTPMDGLLKQLSVADGVLDYKASTGKMCWKTSYTRGVGSVPTACSTTQENQAGLCYDQCKTNFVGAGPVCWGTCPGGYRNDPAHCGKPEAYGRGAGYPWKFGDALNLDAATARCSAENREAGCEKDGEIIYPRCRPGFHKVGCCICSPDCPASFADIGVSCEKPSYGRGVGKVPSCAGSLSSDTGLCYPTCSRDFDGIGPVCWGKCTKEYPFVCGAGCAASEVACAAAVSEQVLSTVSVAVNLLSIPFGGPGITAAGKTAVQAGQKAAGQVAARTSSASLTAALVPASKAFAREFGKTFVKSYLKSMVTSKRNLISKAFTAEKAISLMALNKAANEMGQMKTEGQFDFSLLTIADPTGIASMVYAFAQYGVCEIEEIVPSVRSLDFGTANLASPEAKKTIEITFQQQATITEIATNAMKGCSIEPTSNCVGRTMQPGQKCTIEVRATGANKIDGELRLYTTSYNAVPFAIPVTANTGAATECPEAGDEAVNLSSVAGAWAWNNDQSTKFVIRDDGSLTSWIGQGTAKLIDPIARTFALTLGFAKGNATLTVEHERMSIISDGKTIGATKRPWDARCKPGETFFGGLCYDIPIGYAPTAPGFMGKVCRNDWRDDGTQCWPPWSGATVWAQADPEGTFTMRHPMLVTDCANYSQVNKQTCPVNYKNSGGPAGCSCDALPTSKEVKSIIGSGPLDKPWWAVNALGT